MQAVALKQPVDREDRYPVGTSYYTPIGTDCRFLDKKLSEQSLELFQISGGGIDILDRIIDDESKTLQTRHRFVSSEVIEAHGIPQHLQDEKFGDILIIMKPAFSWSQICITELAFRRTLAALKVFTPFLHVVHTFGTKTSDKQRSRNVVYCHIGPSYDFQFCYNIRYFELNGRKRGNPWSLRQTGVYQNCLSNKQSTWILLNYSTYIQERVSEACVSAERPFCEASPLVPHLFLLSAATRNWHLYTDMLREKVAAIEQKTYLSGVDQSPAGDHPPLLSDIRELRRLGDAIAMASTVLKGQEEVASKCRGLCESLAKGHPNRDMAATIHLLEADLQHYDQDLTSLSRAAAVAEQLISIILVERANNKLQATVGLTQNSVSELQLQSRRMNTNVHHLLQVTQRGHRDSVTIKILAEMAMLFLPASLVASLFSSTLLEDLGDGVSHVALYFEITLPLLVATAIALVILEKGLPKGTWLRRLANNLLE